MTSSTILTANSNFSDAALPVLYKDGLINAGSKFLFDFGDTYCLNGSVAGAIANATVFRNLVDGAPTAGNAGSTTTLSAGGGLVFAGTANGATYLNLGNTYSLHALNHPFLVIGWAKVAANAGNDRGVLQLGSANATYQYSLETSSGGAFLGGAPNVGAVMQVAYAWSPDGVTQWFANGALRSLVGGGATTLADFSASTTKVGMDPGNIPMIGTVYRVYQEDLFLSGASPLEQVAADWAANNGRFS